MFGKKKQQTHGEMVLELRELEHNLEIKASSDYQENKKDLKNCARCDVPPEHSYDSFGMPMHRLECSVCHSYIEFPKSFEGAKDKWNNLQEKTPPC